MAIEVFIEEDYVMHVKKVYVIDRRSSETIHYNLNEKGELIGTVVKSSVFDNDLKPFMIMPREIGDALLLGFTKALTAKGIRTESESVQEGKLKAMESHLKDMRRIAFKQLKIDN